MIGEEKLESGFAGLGDLRSFGPDDHAFGDGERAACHQLGHLFDFDQAHAAGGLQRQAFPVAEGGDLDAGALGGVDDKRARGGFDGLSVDGEFY